MEIVQQLAEVIPLKGKRTFTYEEACRLLPIVRRLTADAIRKTEVVMQKLETLNKNTPERYDMELQLNSMIEEWVQKIERLGCEAKGLWLIDFDSGAGYFCWQFGESHITHFHGYAEGFASRRPLEFPRIH